MGDHGHACSAGGQLNDQKFSAPMPWIGVYIAAASAACIAAMAADLVHGFRCRKFWFPCKFFSINATSLTLLAVVVKLSVDLNTSMPGRRDQLAKLSSAVLTCTVMANSMPSLGTMGTEDLLMNIMALAILVITLLVNICIQLATGAIFVFLKEHAVIMFIMLVLLFMLSFSALTVPTTKSYLEYKYENKYQLALKEAPEEASNYRRMATKLRDDMTKYWVMAHTCSPQFVMGRSVTCTASGAFCLVGALVLAEAMIRSYFMPRSLRFCSGDSDYKWSTTLVLVTQTVAVCVGTIAPACRWLFAIQFRCPYRGNKKVWKKEFKVEKYWIQNLEEMKECPLTSAIFKLRSRNSRRLVNNTKNQMLDLCIAMQIGIVSASKLIRFVSIFSVSQVLLFWDFCRSLKRKPRLGNIVSGNDLEEDSMSMPDRRMELGRFVLHLEGEEALVDLMIVRNCDATKHWFHLGRKRQPKYLIKLLEKSSQGLRGLAEFDNDDVPCLDHEDPPNSWALPVVTLISIALALPGINECLIKHLRCGVSQGLVYVKHLEKYLDTKADLSNIRKAAEVLWTEVDLYNKWLDFDLSKMSLDQEKTPREVVEQLSEMAKDKFMEFKKVYMATCLKENPLKWHTKVLAANSMYRISQSLLLHCEKNNQTAEKLFEAISTVISDILCACMTNLHQVISVKCLSSRIEEREESVRRSVFVLGKTEDILNIIDRREIPDLDSKQMGCINEWRLSHKSNKSCKFASPPRGTDDVCIAVDYKMEL